MWLQTRLCILKVCTELMPLGADVCLEELAQKTEFYSGADLQNLCKEVTLHIYIYCMCVYKLFIFQAALLALQEETMKASAIKHTYFLQALSRMRPSLSAQQINCFQTTPR